MLKGRKLFVGCGNDVGKDFFDLLIGLIAESFRIAVGNDDRGDHDLVRLLFLSAENDRFQDLGILSEMLLKLFGEYVFTVRKNDYVLFSAGNIYISLFYL